MNKKKGLNKTMAEGFFALQELDQLKALADPLRQRILQALCQEPMTTKQVAQQLGEKPTRLYHHVSTLEQAGLIQIVETRLGQRERRQEQDPRRRRQYRGVRPEVHKRHG